MKNQQSTLITGSTSGIGKAIATVMAKAGYNVVLNGFGDPAEIEGFRSGLEAEYGIRVVYSCADMRAPQQIRELATTALNQFDCIDVLVNNAGIQHVEAIETFPSAKWDEIVAINLSASFHTIQNLLPAMKAKGRGRIINIASAHALVASPFKSAYVAAKHGLLGLTRTVALELAETGVTCNAICPGYVYTPLVEGQIEDTAKARGISRESVIRDILLAAQPTKQFVRGEDLAALIVFLAGEHADAINGAALSIDGGWTAR
jgi:3-hydroxybutyrate dehydrogenase